MQQVEAEKMELRREMGNLRLQVQSLQEVRIGAAEC